MCQDFCGFPLDFFGFLKIFIEGLLCQLICKHPKYTIACKDTLKNPVWIMLLVFKRISEILETLDFRILERLKVAAKHITH